MFQKPYSRGPDSFSVSRDAYEVSKKIRALQSSRHPDLVSSNSDHSRLLLGWNFLNRKSCLTLHRHEPLSEPLKSRKSGFR